MKRAFFSWQSACERAGLVVGLLVLVFASAQAQDKVYEDKIGAGDTIRVQVYQSPDLSLETRVLETGHISYPLIGATKVAGLTIPEAEKHLGQALKTGGFLQAPQIAITLLSQRRKQVNVLGAVGRSGPVQLEATNTRLSDVLAVAGGILPSGSDIAVVTGLRGGKPIRQEVNVPEIFLSGKSSLDIQLASGDTIYVHRAPIFYVYGEAQRPGSYRIERNMTFMQALAVAGGPTARGNEKRLRIHRVATDGSVKEMNVELLDPVQPDDVIFVRESLF